VKQSRMSRALSTARTGCDKANPLCYLLNGILCAEGIYRDIGARAADDARTPHLKRITANRY
jgi:hypothetical protein